MVLSAVIRHDMMVSWHDTMILWHDMIISCHDTTDFGSSDIWSDVAIIGAYNLCDNFATGSRYLNEGTEMASSRRL